MVLVACKLQQRTWKGKDTFDCENCYKDESGSSSRHHSAGVQDMKRVVICLFVGVIATVLLGEAATAEPKPAYDPFESRRRDAEYRQKLREQQARANQRVVPTFTIPQPTYNNRFNNRFNNGLNNNFYNQRTDPRYDPRYYDRNYVYIPGHYQNVFGRLVYVPPHFDFVPR